MKKLIEFLLEGGDVMLIEVEADEPEKSGLVPANLGVHGENLPERATMTFQEAIDKVKPGAEIIIKKLRGLTDPPDEMQIAFGLKLNAAAGAVIASAGIEANYTVTLKWFKQPKK
jgi:hypothetical protein